jgi:alkylated DNA repair dioxygenase AlkB
MRAQRPHSLAAGRSTQDDLFGTVEASWPSGFRYDPSLLSEEESAELLQSVAVLPFKEFEFHGFQGKRRVVSYGWKFDFSAQRIRESDPIPPFLLPLRERAASFAKLGASALEHVLVTEYRPGAAIGWHRDKGVFDKVVGVSLGSACTMRFRRKAGQRWERSNVALSPGSAYLIDGEARSEWEHSIPPVADL